MSQTWHQAGTTRSKESTDTPETTAERTTRETRRKESNCTRNRTDRVALEPGASPKPNKLRICLDPKDLNRALERARYPMPTVEDAMPQLANAKLFSKLDAKDGFWQVVLDKESSYCTTFFGRHLGVIDGYGCHLASQQPLRNSKGAYMKLWQVSKEPFASRTTHLFLVAETH